MENQGNQTPEEGGDWMNREPGVSADLQAVRSALRTLPRARCPIGFETRLQRRIMQDSTGRERVRTSSNWSLGWTGVGLGFAAALVIAVVAFDFNFSGSGSVQMAGDPSATQPAGQQVPDVMASEAQEAAPSKVPETLRSTTPILVEEKPAEIAAVKPDSNSARAKEQQRVFPEGLYHTVGGNTP